MVSYGFKIYFFEGNVFIGDKFFFEYFFIFDLIVVVVDIFC